MARQDAPATKLNLFLIGVLLVSLGAAAGLTAYVNWQQRVPLMAAQPLGPFVLRPPRGWAARASAGVLALEEPAARGRNRRRLEVSLHETGQFLSPMEFLVRNGDVSLQDAAALLTARPDAPSPIGRITLAGFPGIVLAQTRVLRSPDLRQAQQIKQLLACTVLPSRQAITLRLEGAGPVEAHDQQLLKRLAESLSVADQPEIVAGPTIELPMDIDLDLPRTLRTLATQDRFRVDRILVAEDWEGYLAVDLAPCVALTGDPAGELRSMLMLRDPGFRPGPMRKLDDRTVGCLRRAEDLFPAAAFLHVHADGRALLAEFRWTSSKRSAGDADAVGELWRQIGLAARFSGGGQVKTLTEAGAAAVRSLPDDLAGLLSDDWPLTRQWRWSDDALPQPAVSVIHGTLEGSDILGISDADRTPLAPRFGRELVRFRLARDGTSYDYSAIRVAPASLLSQETHLADGKLRSIVRRGARTVAQFTSSRPELYVPGAVLPSALGQFAYQPMILQTESVPSADPLLGAMPLALILEPAFDVPRRQSGEAEPMRCWSVRVSGTGQSSRWYYDKLNRLQLITFPGGIHAERVDAAGPATAPAEDEPHDP